MFFQVFLIVCLIVMFFVLDFCFGFLEPSATVRFLLMFFFLERGKSVSHRCLFCWSLFTSSLTAHVFDASEGQKRYSRYPEGSGFDVSRVDHQMDSRCCA